jgi:hypothetical protein
MAATTSIESLQCFAFAYFAATSPSSSNHQENWFDIFDNIEISISELNNKCKLLRSTYKDYLSSTFSEEIFKNVLEKYGSELTPSGKVSVSPYVKKVYLVSKKVASTSLLDTWSNYVFLDQSDPFTKLVKNSALQRVASAFDMLGKDDLLSPVDMFAVKKNKITSISTEISTHIINCTDQQILSNTAWGKTGKNTYRTILNKYFKTKSLIGISLKLPETIGGSGVLKIVGTENVDKSLLSFVDPYTKLIAAILAHPTKTKQLIEQVIDIEFNEFRITPDLLSWEYPVTFRYKDVLDPRVLGPGSQSLYHKNLRLKLFTWSNAGFNATWYPGQGAPGNWTGGASTIPIDELFIRYREYPTVLSELVNLRKEAFFYAIHGSTKDPSNKIPSNLKSDYEKALNDVEKRVILTSSKKNRGGEGEDLMNFLTSYSKSSNKYYVYQTHLIKNTTKLMRGASRTVTTEPKRLNAHYVACQCAWFLFRGGPSAYKYLKQRMFLSLFGLITKSGYKIFQGDEDTIMEDYLQKSFSKNKKQITAYFNSAPHIVLS